MRMYSVGNFIVQGSIQERVEDFHNLWRNPDVRLILMTLGGHTAVHLLPHLDYELV